jgi:hypothetical protein
LRKHLHSALEARGHRLREARLQEIVEELGRLTRRKSFDAAAASQIGKKWMRFEIRNKWHLKCHQIRTSEGPAEFQGRLAP